MDVHETDNVYNNTAQRRHTNYETHENTESATKIENFAFNLHHLSVTKYHKEWKNFNLF